jgi:hypothetical protein
MIRDLLGQVDEKTILCYIYNLNTEQVNLNIMNEALEKSDKKTEKTMYIRCTYQRTKNPLKNKGLSTRRDSKEPRLQQSWLRYVPA